MNTTLNDKVLPKHVRDFQDVYPKDLLTSTLIKPSIIVVNLDKHYMPGSHCVAVCISETLGTMNILIRMFCQSTSLKS